MHLERDKYLELYKEETRECLERLNNILIEMEEDPTNVEIINEAFRIFHTLKGMAASFGYKEIESISHDLEECLEGLKELGKGVSKEIIDRVFKGVDNIEDLMEKIGRVKDKEEIEPKEEKSRVARVGVGGIRVNVELLDRLQNIAGELVVFSSQLSALLSDTEDKKFKGFLEAHNRSLTELQDVVTKIRLVPLSLIFNKFHRYVRDLSEELNKEVSIDIFGAEIEVDRSLLEGISEPLIHLVRNAVGHGIESPKERRRLKKSKTGKITVTAKRVKDDILIEISDDGKGINEKEVLSSAIRKGLVKEEEESSLTKKEILHFLFMPGFTTDERVSEVSGRGIGLNVVKQVIRSVGGSVDIRTEMNKGTTITMKMPLSMAIIRVYLFQSNGQLYALPMTFVDETLMISGELLSQLLGKEVMFLRKEVLPVYHFSNIMRDHSDDESDESKDNVLSCLVVEVEGERFVLIVDKFRGSCNIVIKPLPVPINAIKEYTGITIIGDGQPCLIIDLPSVRYRRIYENTGS